MRPRFRRGSAILDYSGPSPDPSGNSRSNGPPSIEPLHISEEVLLPDLTQPVSPNEQRDHLANVRTMLAWVRTSVTIMALGFVVAKFGIVLEEIPGRRHMLDLRLAAGIGTALVIAGGVLILIAAAEFVTVSRAIQSGQVYFRRGLLVGLTLLLVAIAILLAVYLLVTS